MIMILFSCFELEFAISNVYIYGPDLAYAIMIWIWQYKNIGRKQKLNKESDLELCNLLNQGNNAHNLLGTIFCRK